MILDFYLPRQIDGYAIVIGPSPCQPGWRPCRTLSNMLQLTQLDQIDWILPTRTLPPPTQRSTLLALRIWDKSCWKGSYFKSALPKRRFNLRQLTSFARTGRSWFLRRSAVNPSATIYSRNRGLWPRDPSREIEVSLWDLYFQWTIFNRKVTMMQCFIVELIEYDCIV